MASFRPQARLVLLAAAPLLRAAVLDDESTCTASQSSFTVTTWNMAAINNNPFEYWITHSDPSYNALMETVESYIEAPNDSIDVPVHHVLPDALLEELSDRMRTLGWEGVDEAVALYVAEYRDRRVISQFLKDASIGKKRLASMPDRVTNTISTSDGSVALRPTVINCYEGDLSSVHTWWDRWKVFVFETELEVGSKKKDGTTVASSKKAVHSMFKKIKSSKYPAVTAAEEAISVPLQAISLAVFDATLVHMLNRAMPPTAANQHAAATARGLVHGSTSDDWQAIRSDLCDKLNRNKVARTIEILQSQYSTSDIVFLQEVAGAFVGKAKVQSLKGAKPLSSTFDVLAPASLDLDRDQNSLILLRKGVFKRETVAEVTASVMALLAEAAAAAGAKVPVSDGDLFAVIVDSARGGDQHLLASFHGDTNGLATIPVVDALHRYAMQLASIGAPVKLLFGLDANAHEFAGKMPGERLFVSDLNKTLAARGLRSCYSARSRESDLELQPSNYTTFHARTFLQPQLNKAVKLADKDHRGDKNPKDHILFDAQDYELQRAWKDNTGEGEYVEGMVFPTLNFPSDHAVSSAVLRQVGRPSGSCAASSASN